MTSDGYDIGSFYLKRYANKTDVMIARAMILESVMFNICFFVPHSIACLVTYLYFHMHRLKLIQK